MDDKESELDFSDNSPANNKMESLEKESKMMSRTDSPDGESAEETEAVKEEDDSDQETPVGGKGKPTLSYIALISMAILSSPGQRMLLSEIYSWIAKNYPYYKHKDRSWRNSIRHNLSLNECFIKAGRSENGKGNYWTIHPANTTDFGQGDFRRRRARRRVRQCNEELERLRSGLLGMPEPSSTHKDPQDLARSGDFYVPMTSTWAPKSVLASIFGQDVVLSQEEKNCMKRKRYFHQRNGLNSHSQNNNVSSYVFQTTNTSSVDPQFRTTSGTQERSGCMRFVPQSSAGYQTHVQTRHQHQVSPNTWSATSGMKLYTSSYHQA